MHDRTLKRIFILAGIALVLWILYLLKPVVIPFVAAFLVAYLFSPVVDKLSKVLPRWLSITDLGNMVCCALGLETINLCP